MQLKFRDFYRQYVTISDETASGNIRLKVRTMPDLNDVGRTREEDCTIETDISLTREQANLLCTTLNAMSAVEE